MADFFHDRWDDVPDPIIDAIQDRSDYSDQELYQAHYMVFDGMLEGSESTQEKEQLWNDYLEAMVEGTMDRDAFFEEMYIDEGDFDWDAWREAMGY